MSKSKIFSAVALAMLLAASLVPILNTTDSSAEENSADTIMNAELKNALIDAGYFVIERDGQEYVVIDGTEYEIAEVGAFFIGLAIGLLIAGVVYLLAAPQINGMDPEAVKQQLRTAEAGKVMAALDTAKNIASGVLPADATLWKFTTTYWQRAVEYYVAEFWEDGGTLDIDEAINGIDLYKNVANYLYSWSEALDEAYNNYLSYPNRTGNNWTQDGLNSMDVRIQWDNGGISGGTPITSSYNLWSDLAQYVSTSSGHNIAYIDTNPPTTGMGGTEWYDTLYYFGSGTATLINADSGLEYRLNSGANLTSSIYCVSTLSSGKLPAGTYIIENGKNIAGPIIPSGSESAADVHGVLVFGNASATYYALSTKGDSKVEIYNSSGSKIRDSAYLQYQVKYDDGNGIQTAESAIFGPDKDNPSVEYNIVGDYDALLTAVKSVLYDVREDALATWGIFDILEESSPVISPSTIRTTAEGMPMTSAEYVATYIQMMIQAHDIVAQNWDNIEMGSININPESLSLYCYGDIYKNGVLWAENVVFTPYINNTTQSLAIGNNAWSGTGHAMIWWQGESFSLWTGSASLSQYSYVALDKNTTIDIKQIVKDHTNVSSVILTKSEIVKYNPGSDVPVDTPEVPQVHGGSRDVIVKLIIVIACLAAALVFMVLYYIDEDYLLIGAALAAIIFVAMYLLSGTIADMLTGNFHFSIWHLFGFFIGGG